MIKLKAVFISEDLIFEILVRVPVKSSVRLRCVCKLWCRIISKSSFIESYQKRIATRSDRNFLLICYPPRSDQLTEEVSILHAPMGKRRLQGRVYPRSNSHYLSKSINRLICLRESVILLQLPRSPSSRLDLLESRWPLGYDPCSNTYKILRMLTFEKLGDPHFGVEYVDL